MDEAVQVGGRRTHRHAIPVFIPVPSVAAIATAAGRAAGRRRASAGGAAPWHPPGGGEQLVQVDGGEAVGGCFIHGGKATGVSVQVHVHDASALRKTLRDGSRQGKRREKQVVQDRNRTRGRAARCQRMGELAAEG